MRLRILLSTVIITSFLVSCDSGSKKLILRKIPPSQRKGLMVLNFKNNTLKSVAEEYQPWEFGIASMIMTDLDAIGLFNIISREMLKTIVKEQEFQLTGLVDPKKAVKLGRLAAAKYILAGSFMEMRGSLRIESQVFSVETGAQLGAASVMGKTDTFFDLQKELLLKVTKFLDAMLTAEEQVLIARNIETKSVRASLSNYKGEIELMKSEELKAKGKAEESKKIKLVAKKDFERALSYDPNYERAKENLSRISLAIPTTL
jgi:TolB-like protein